MKLTALLLLVLAVSGPAWGYGPVRDPFVRALAPAAMAAAAGAAAAAVAAHPEPPKPRLRAILYARGHALADIDGQVLREGEWYGDWRITKIEERSVSLKRREEDLVLLLDREKAQ